MATARDEFTSAQDIATSVRSRIFTHDLEPGEPLPSVRAFAEMIPAAPGTVQRALALLEADGLIINRGIRGRIVAPGAPTARALLALQRLRSVIAELLNQDYTAPEIDRALAIVRKDLKK